MTRPSDPRAPGVFAKLSPLAQWGVLVAGSALLAEMFVMARLPAALLLGPVVAGIVVGSNGGRIRAPRLPSPRRPLSVALWHRQSRATSCSPFSRIGRCS